MLYENDFSIEFVNDIVDEPLANRSILLNKIESLYLGQVDKLRDIISYHRIKGLPFEVIVLGLMEMFPNEAPIREVLMGDVDDGQEERGFYSVIASIFINHPQALADQSSQIQRYFPYSTLPRMLAFRGDKVRLMEEVQARGLSQSNIFKNFVAQNELKNIGFQYCFIGLDVLERALPSEWHTSVCTTILGHLTEDEVQFLRNEFSLNYCSDFRKYGQLGFRKYQKSKSDFHYPSVIELLKKDACTSFLLTSSSEGPVSEWGVYLISAFFIYDGVKTNFPRPPDLDPHQVSETFMDRLFGIGSFVADESGIQG